MDYVWQLFQAGGIVMYPLLFFLVVAWTITLERWKRYKQVQEEVDVVVKIAEEGQRTGNWVQLMNDVEATGTELGYRWLPTLEASKDQAYLESRLYSLLTAVDGELKEGLQWLSTIVTMAPLLGLLGTVVGMIRTFSVMGDAEQGAMMITGGVSEALIATATGLVVAIIALCFHSACAHRVNRLVAQLETIEGYLLDAFSRGRSL